MAKVHLLFNTILGQYQKRVSPSHVVRTPDLGHSQNRSLHGVTALELGTGERTTSGGVSAVIRPDVTENGFQNYGFKEGPVYLRLGIQN